MKIEELTKLGIAEDAAKQVIALSEQELADVTKKYTDSSTELKAANDNLAALNEKVKAFDGVDVEKLKADLAAFRFAAYAGVDGISKVESGATLSSGNDVLTAILAANNTLDEDEALANNRHLFITPTLYNLAMSVDSTKSKAMLDDFAGVHKVPQTRFYKRVMEMFKSGKM